MKTPKIGVNFYKVLIGVGFSLLWAKAMYLIWGDPSYVTFIWFYLVIGSMLLKWVIFEIIDRIHLKAKFSAVQRELKDSEVRVQEAVKIRHQESLQPVSIDGQDFTALDKRLRQLEDKVLSLGSMVEVALERSLESIAKRNIELAREVIADENKVDLSRSAIEAECMQLIATGHAKDSDLRRIIAVIGIATELERMGDYAEGIANITLMIGSDPHIEPTVEISHMARKGIEMLCASLESFTERDVEKAKRICEADDEVDALYDHTFRELLLFIIAHPDAVTQATWLIWVAHNLERFADRVTNICERVVFDVTGELVDIGTSKY